jgi:hypothetical protein
LELFAVSELFLYPVLIIEFTISTRTHGNLNVIKELSLPLIAIYSRSKVSWVSGDRIDLGLQPNGRILFIIEWFYSVVVVTSNE